MQDNSLSKQFFYLNKTFPELNYVEEVHTADSELEMTHSLAQGSSVVVWQELLDCSFPKLHPVLSQASFSTAVSPTSASPL